jgi:mRNA degradation ribonuclease J1/J2
VAESLTAIDQRPQHTEFRKYEMNYVGDDLAFLPLGGTGEIGMNLNLYRSNGQYLAIDCGIGFGGAAHPEVEDARSRLYR